MKLVYPALFSLLFTSAPAFRQQLYRVQREGVNLQESHQSPREKEQLYLFENRSELLGFDSYMPKHVNPSQLLGAGKLLTETRVIVGVPDGSGELDGDKRERMFLFGPAIGIQDFEAGRIEALKLLSNLDARMGEFEAETEPEQDSDFVEVLRLRSLDVFTAQQLIERIICDVQVEAVSESRSLILRGFPQRVADARGLIERTDRVAPQFTLTCMVVGPAEGEGDPTLPADLVQGLTALTGVPQFRRLGSLLARGSVSGTSKLSVTGQFPNLGQIGDRSASITLQASPNAYDEGTQTLSLKSCVMGVKRPVPTSLDSQRTMPQSIAAGWSNELLETDLSLVASEYTVVGALGSDQVFLVLRFTAN